MLKFENTLSGGGIIYADLWTFVLLQLQSFSRRSNEINELKIEDAVIQIWGFLYSSILLILFYVKSKIFSFSASGMGLSY